MRKTILVIAVFMIIGLGLSYNGYCLAEGSDSTILEIDDTGDDVILLQLRLKDLGYYSYKITNYFGSFTKSALISFQKENDLPATGVLDEKTYEILYSNLAHRKEVHTVVKSVYTGQTTVPSTTKATGNVIVASNSTEQAPSLNGEYGALKDWFSYVDGIFKKGEIVTVYAVDSGISFQVRRLGGSKHADVEPVTSEDTLNFQAAHGGTFNWARMAVIVEIDGELIAASMNGQPHGINTITDNNFNGHCCMHFLNSRTHSTNSMCADHQAMVMRAAGY